MMPTEHHQNDILIIILTFVIQAGVWLTEAFANITLEGIYELSFNAAKLSALCASIWASYRVGKKNKS